MSPAKLFRSGAAPLVALAVLTYGAAQTPAALTTLYSFSGENGDGAGPYSAVSYSANGVLYGTTAYGGVYNSGTVFELTPPAAPGGTWTETVLHSFGSGSDGAYPYAGVVTGSNRVLYGTTNYGGASGMGIVYQLTPPSVPGGAWTETILHTFSGNDGAYPYATLALAGSGALYGTTELGGTSDYGTVFELTPPAGGSGAWTQNALYNFSGGSDGCCPYAPLTIGANGALYSTTAAGGSSARGTVFKLTRQAGGAWKETVLRSFNGGDGGFPYCGVAIGTNGTVYATTAGSVNAGAGSAVELTPPSGTSKTWTETVLYKFTGKADGGAPHAAPVFGPNGTLYGTAFGGGSGSRFNGSGLIYQLTPPAGTGSWIESVLYTFHGPDGSSPNASLIPGPNGVFYGTTLGGGAFGQGTVFEFTP